MVLSQTLLRDGMGPYYRTQLSSERREVLEWGLAREIELSFADHVRDLNAFQCCRG